MDVDFRSVIHGCAQPRTYSKDTWITKSMEAAYSVLHEAGFAHSVEIRQHGEIVGGLYGVALGEIFFGESMFSSVADASKVGLVALCGQLERWGFRLIDCQIRSDHLIRLGAIDIPRCEFIRLLGLHTGPNGQPGKWVLDDDI